MFNVMITNLAIGLFSSLATGMGTYVAKMKGGEEFSTKKFGRTMATGAAAGLAMGLAGNTVDSPEGMVTSTGLGLGLVNVLDQGVKFIWRLFSKKKAV
jgi:hypothetical protein